MCMVDATSVPKTGSRLRDSCHRVFQSSGQNCSTIFKRLEFQVSYSIFKKYLVERILTYQWSTDAMQSAASAAKHAEHGLSKTAPAQLDEFGRDISLETGGLESERQSRLSCRNLKMKVCVTPLSNFLS